IFADLQSDGSFKFDALPAGKYKLLVDIHGERPPETCGWGLMLAQGSTDFAVGDQPVSLPVLSVSVTKRPQASSPAPQLAALKSTNERFDLSALRGKYVVLDFWAGWCAPCRAAQPALKAIDRKYKDKVSIVGLNFDYTDAKAKEAIESIHTPWPQLM